MILSFQQGGIALLTFPSGSVFLAASRGLQRLAVVLLMMNGLASPRGISANPAGWRTGVREELRSRSLLHYYTHLFAPAQEAPLVWTPPRRSSVWAWSRRWLWFFWSDCAGPPEHFLYRWCHRDSSSLTRPPEVLKELCSLCCCFLPDV